MPGHAATGTSPGPAAAQIIIEDNAHPSTKHLGGPLDARGRVVQLLDQRPRQRARAALDGREHVRPGRQRDGLRPSDLVVQALRRRPRLRHRLGHFGAHYAGAARSCSTSSAASSRPPASRPGDCGGTIDSNFEKVALDENTSAPFALDVAPDGRVFFTELVRGQIRVYDPQTRTSRPRSRSTSTRAARTACWASRSTPSSPTTAGSTSTTRPTRRTTPTRRASSAASPASRSTRTPTIDPASEQLIIEVPPAASRTSPATPAAPRLRPRRQPAARRRRRRQPALRALGRLRAARPSARPARSTTPARRRPTRTTCAASCCASSPSRRRRLHDPGGQPLRRSGHRADPARDLRDGLPQPVPLLRRPDHGLDRPRRLRARQRHRAPRTRAARPASSSTT